MDFNAFDTQKIREYAECAKKEWGEDELKQELSNRKDKIRTIFDKLIETSEPGFLNGLLSALNIPEEIQHLVKSRLIR